MDKINRKKIIIISTVIIIVLIIGFFIIKSIINMNSFKDMVEITVVLEDIYVSPDEQDMNVVLSIREGEDLKKVFTSTSVPIFFENGQKVNFDELSVKQSIKLFVDKTIIYEPVDTYVKCYKIIILS